MYVRPSSGGGGIDLNNYEYNIDKSAIKMTGGVCECTFDKPIYLLQVDLYRGTSMTPVPIMQIYDEDGITPLSDAKTMALNTLISFTNNNIGKPLNRFYLKQTNGSNSWSSNSPKKYVLQPKN